MGRIHRYKQQKEVMIFNLVAANTREGQVMQRLLLKLEAMRQALGSDRVYDVIGEIISAPRFDELMKDWLANRRTLQEILADIDVHTDEEQVARIRTEMRDKALGSRYIDMTSLAEQMRQSRENRLMPEYIEKFFVEAYRSFGGTITPVKDARGLWSISRVPAELRKLPEPLERRFGKVGSKYPCLTFDKEQIGEYQEIEFVGPGHPLFEGITDKVLHDYGDALLHGAIFYDADATEPEILWLLKTGIEDGRGRVVGQRLFAVHKIGDGFSQIMPYAMLDLKSPDAPPELAANVQQHAQEEDSVIDWALDEIVSPYFAEVSDRRNRELAIKEKYVRKSLQYLISESNKKIAKYDAQIRELMFKDDVKSLHIKGNRAQEVARRDELSLRLKDRLQELEYERHLTEQPPELVGVAVILPVPAESVPQAASMRTDPEVEKIAIERAKRYETSQGRIVAGTSPRSKMVRWTATSRSKGALTKGP